MTIQQTQNGSEMTLAFSGWLDTQTSPELHAVIDELDDSVTALVFDFKNLEYLSSAGLREIRLAQRKMDGNLSICHAPPDILGVLEITGFTELVKVEP